MTRDQAAIAVPLLNCYAHDYLGLTLDDVHVTSAKGSGEWLLIIGHPAGPDMAEDFDAGKAIIDRIREQGQ